MRRSWSAASEQRLRELYATTPLDRLSFLLKRTPQAVRSRAKVLRITRGTRRPWTDAEDEQLRKRYAKELAETIALDIGHTRSSVCQRARALGLKKPAAWVASTTRNRWSEGRHEGSRRGHFQKGQSAHNKGIRRPGWAPGRMAVTQFKKGEMHGAAQHNYVPIGTEKVEPKRNVLLRKITDDPAMVPAQRWRAVHVLVWEAVHGPVPEGSIVVFRPGLKTFKAEEITIDRLDLVTRAENMQRNTLHRFPRELRDAMRLVGRVKRQARRLDGEE